MAAWSGWFRRIDCQHLRLIIVVSACRAGYHAWSLDQLSDVNTTLLLTIFLAAQNSISHYWHKVTDKTFAGIYHANAFDLAMMVPYFIVLFVLAVYGLHRYWLVYDYFAYAKNVPPSPPEVKEWPRVTIQLPIFNERYVVERLDHEALVENRELN